MSWLQFAVAFYWLIKMPFKISAGLRTIIAPSLHRQQQFIDGLLLLREDARKRGYTEEYQKKKK